MDKQFWLVTTDHLKDRIWFKDEADYKAGMNFIALVVTSSEVTILAFILMSNHVHFVLESSREGALDFLTIFKKRYSQYYSRKYGTRELLRHNNVDIRRLSRYDESLERAIAYVQMNCVAANICLQPSGYEWGTGKVFFKENQIKYQTVSQINARRLAKMIHSRLKLPPTYLVDEHGYVVPDSYIPVKYVESIFKSPKRMLFFLNNSSKASKQNNIPTFKDQLVKSAIQDICVSVYHKSGIEQLEPRETSELLKQLRYRFSSDPNQISRVTGIPYDEVSKLLDTF